ncbi:MAG: ATP-binding protein [Acidobacteria bacterium]|nr:ATP-binding protein [Acidobacteriota bacterium]MCB9398427.1 ATP-binding protein [Acidobacteriota bacterium]
MNLERCTQTCLCQIRHQPKWVVLTGGPGAGKTAVLELARRTFCQHVVILPEAASVVLRCEMLHSSEPSAKRAAQRVIYQLQWECEELLRAEPSGLIVCDRGLLDGIAYWPKGEQDFLKSLKVKKEVLLNRYDAIIHLRTPSLEQGYNHVNPVRLETAQQAAQIDQSILEIWQDHPQRYVVESQDQFQKKAAEVLGILASLVPDCCQPQ